MEIHRTGPLVAITTLSAPIAWGTTYVAITQFLPDDRPLFVAACRVIPAGVVLVAIGSFTRRDRWRPPNWRQLSVLALFNFGLFLPLLIVAIYRLPGGVAASVGGVQPLLVALIGWRLASIRPRRVDLLVGVAAAIGVAMVVVRPGAAIDPLGVLAAAGANISFAIGVVLTKKFDVVGDRLTTTGIQLLLSAIVIVPLALMVEGGTSGDDRTQLCGCRLSERDCDRSVVCRLVQRNPASSITGATSAGARSTSHRRDTRMAHPRRITLARPILWVRRDHRRRSSTPPLWAQSTQHRPRSTATVHRRER